MGGPIPIMDCHPPNQNPQQQQQQQQPTTTYLFQDPIMLQDPGSNNPMLQSCSQSTCCELLGMILHKMSLAAIFGHKHF